MKLILDSFKWDDCATKLLLSIYKKKSKNVGKVFHLKTKRQLWVHVVEELNKYGYNLTPLQARNRLITLQRAYKKRMMKRNKNDRTISVYDE